MIFFSRLLDPFGLLRFLEDGFGTPRRFPQDLVHAEPLPTEGFNSLPDEVLLRVMSKFGSQEKTDLSNLSKTGRRLYILSRPYLYDRVLLNPLNCCEFYTTLLLWPRLRRYIKTSTIDLGQAIDFSRKAWMSEPAEYVGHILSSCRNLETLELCLSNNEAMRWDWISPHVVLNPYLKKLQSVKHLVITGGRFTVTSVQIPPNVETLFLVTSPGRAWCFEWLEWQACANLRIVKVAQIISDDIQPFFDSLLGGIAQPLSVKMNVCGNAVTDVVVELKRNDAQSSGESHFLSITLGHTSLGPNLKILTDTKVTVDYILRTAGVEKVLIRYSLLSALGFGPQEWQTEDAQTMNKQRTLSEAQLVRLLKEQKEFYDEMLQKISGCADHFARTMEKLTHAEVELEFVDE